MRFPGRFTDSLVAEKLDKISLSFLVDDLELRRGGVAANIAFSLGQLGVRPVLVGAVGADFGDYQQWLEAHGVDCGSVAYSTSRHTARFVCTTDADHNQIASFYPGAMSEARDIALRPVLDRTGGLDLVLISPNDPAAMVRHTRECRELGVPFAADPSQQLARMHRDEVRDLVDGAAYLFTNEYEAALIEQKTGWSADDLLDRVQTRVTTLGSLGVLVERKGEPSVRVGAATVTDEVDPTGVGDAFRAGFLAATSWGAPLERACQVGAIVAALVLETVGPQEYTLEPTAFLERLAGTYGDDAAADLREHVAALAG
nr:carbohydrate kinase family protein [Motilibacter aurantiacus]